MQATKNSPVLIILHRRTSLKSAVDEWISDEVSADASYGHISTWNTALVTDMHELFYQKPNFNDEQ